jgi:hypothetical protein
MRCLPRIFTFMAARTAVGSAATSLSSFPSHSSVWRNAVGWVCVSFACGWGFDLYQFIVVDVMGVDVCEWFESTCIVIVRQLCIDWFVCLLTIGVLLCTPKPNQSHSPRFNNNIVILIGSRDKCNNSHSYLSFSVPSCGLSLYVCDVGMNGDKPAVVAYWSVIWCVVCREWLTGLVWVCSWGWELQTRIIGPSKEKIPSRETR